MKRSIAFLIAGVFAVSGVLVAQDNNQPKGKFSGYMMGDYFYNITRNATAPGNAALTGDKSMQGFQFRRIYFTYDNDISSVFTSRFRLEADQGALTTGKKSTDGDGTYDGKISVFVKDAFLKWKNVFKGSDLTFGIQPTTAYDISEAAWGYRSLEKTIMDLRGIIPSRDFGLSLRGKIDEDGMFNYWAMVANGDGNKPASTKFKRYSLTLQVKPDNNWQATLTGDYKAMPSIDDPTSTSVPRTTISNDMLTGALFVGYKATDQYSFGVEGFMASDFNGYTDPSGHTLKNLNLMGVSAFLTVNLEDDIILIGRYDYYDPNTNSDSKGDSRNYIIGALAWKPDKNVSIMPNVQIETYETPISGTSIDAAVTGRLTFYYIFL